MDAYQVLFYRQQMLESIYNYLSLVVNTVSNNRLARLFCAASYLLFFVWLICWHMVIWRCLKYLAEDEPREPDCFDNCASRHTST